MDTGTSPGTKAFYRNCENLSCITFSRQILRHFASISQMYDCLFFPSFKTLRYLSDIHNPNNKLTSIIVIYTEVDKRNAQYLEKTLIAPIAPDIPLIKKRFGIRQSGDYHLIFFYACRGEVVFYVCAF
jgi:hypothetical protein